MSLLNREPSPINSTEDKYLALQVLGCTNGDAHWTAPNMGSYSPHQLSEYARRGLTVPSPGTRIPAGHCSF